ncbi:MAG TPA: hypothetical protein VID77_10355 [Stellaceae bacterium]|jgi:hypothetical protein
MATPKKDPKPREIEQRTEKIREHLTKAHAATKDHPSGSAIANISAEIQILLREIEEIASTMG